jgi:hypothetical protein
VLDDVLDVKRSSARWSASPLSQQPEVVRRGLLRKWKVSREHHIISGWKLNPTQLQNVVNRGSL